MIWKELLDIDVAQARAQAQAALGGDKAAEAFKDYSKLAFRKKEKEKEEKDIMQKRFEQVARMGPISFEPIELPKPKSGPLPKVRKP